MSKREIDKLKHTFKEIGRQKIRCLLFFFDFFIQKKMNTPVYPQNWSDFGIQVLFCISERLTSELQIVLAHPKTQVKWVLRLEPSYECQTQADCGGVRKNTPSNYCDSFKNWKDENPSQDLNHRVLQILYLKEVLRPYHKEITYRRITISFTAEREEYLAVGLQQLCARRLLTLCPFALREVAPYSLTYLIMQRRKVWVAYTRKQKWFLCKPFNFTQTLKPPVVVTELLYVHS